MDFLTVSPRMSPKRIQWDRGCGPRTPGGNLCEGGPVPLGKSLCERRPLYPRGEGCAGCFSRSDLYSIRALCSIPRTGTVSVYVFWMEKAL